MRRTSVIDLFLSICRIRRGPEKSRGKGLEPDDISQKKSIEHRYLLFTLSYTIPGVPCVCKCHPLRTKPSKMMYSLKRKDSIFAQERHTVVMVEFPMSLRANARHHLSSLLWPLLSSLPLSLTFKQTEKKSKLHFHNHFVSVTNMSQVTNCRSNILSILSSQNFVVR